jgi:LemA protein
MAEKDFDYDVYEDKNSNTPKPLPTAKIILSLVVVIVVFVFISSYNKLVTKDEQVSEAYAQIESNLQRKLDLLPNLVKVVKSYAKHEDELFTKIAQLRSSKTDNQKDIKQIEKLNSKLNISTLKLFAVAENYPNLKSSEQFLQLQAQIEGADNRINITRMNYNESVKNYNKLTKVFPSNLIASMFGFEKKEYFKAEAEAHKKMDLDL